LRQVECRWTGNDADRDEAHNQWLTQQMPYEAYGGREDKKSRYLQE
jgi:hypothetical protein